MSAFLDDLADNASDIRTERTCRGCGRAKDAGLMVCWVCFKHRTDVTPFKYWYERGGYVEGRTEEEEVTAWLRAVTPVHGGNCTSIYGPEPSDADPGL